MMLIILPVAAVLILWRRDLPDENRDDGTLNAERRCWPLPSGWASACTTHLWPGHRHLAIIAFTTLMGFDLRTAGGNARCSTLPATTPAL